LKGALSTPTKKHFPAITEPQHVRRLLSMIYNYHGTATVRFALKLAPLVFVRPKELRFAEWQEINFQISEWRIPARKMKMGEDHIVPLSTQALHVFQEQFLLTRTNEIPQSDTNPVFKKLQAIESLSNRSSQVRPISAPTRMQ